MTARWAGVFAALLAVLMPALMRPASAEAADVLRATIHAAKTDQGARLALIVGGICQSVIGETGEEDGPSGHCPLCVTAAAAVLPRAPETGVPCGDRIALNRFPPRAPPLPVAAPSRYHPRDPPAAA